MARLKLPLIICLVVFVWFVVGVGPYLISNSSFSDKILFLPKAKGIEKFAQLGDSFGIVNALFAALAFAGIAWSIALQREQLQIQREEFKRSIEEMAAASQAQVETSKAMGDAARAQLRAAECAEAQSKLQAAIAKVESYEKIRNQKHDIYVAAMTRHKDDEAAKKKAEIEALVWEKRYRISLSELASFSGDPDNDGHNVGMM